MKKMHPVLKIKVFLYCDNFKKIQHIYLNKRQ